MSVDAHWVKKSPTTVWTLAVSSALHPTGSSRTRQREERGGQNELLYRVTSDKIRLIEQYHPAIAGYFPVLAVNQWGT